MDLEYSQDGFVSFILFLLSLNEVFDNALRIIKALK